MPHITQRYAGCYTVVKTEFISVNPILPRVHELFKNSGTENSKLHSNFWHMT